MRYQAADRLLWKQVKGPAAGSSGIEATSMIEIRPRVVFITWQEKDLSVVSQVVDFERGAVFTAWVSAVRALANFQGKVKETFPAQ